MEGLEAPQNNRVYCCFSLLSTMISSKTPLLKTQYTLAARHREFGLELTWKPPDLLAGFHSYCQKVLSSPLGKKSHQCLIMH